MATRTVTRRSAARPAGVAGKFAQFLALTNDVKTLTGRAGEIKKELMSFTEQHGEPDEKGHLLHTLADAVEVGGQKFLGFMRQRRVSQTFNEDAAKTLCEAKGFAIDEYISVTEYVDQDKVARLYAEDKITEEEFDVLLEENITWAFVPVKDS